MIALNEVNYGGAFDIDPEQYFTDEDILDFAENIINVLTRNTPHEFDLVDVYMDKDNNLHLELCMDNDYNMTSTVYVDMRRIKKPSDLSKYTNEVLTNFIMDINTYCVEGVKPNGIEIYKNSYHCVQGSEMEKELELVAKQLEKMWIDRLSNPDVLVKYYVASDSDNILFLVYSDAYSGMVKYVAQTPYTTWCEDELDESYIMSKFKQVWSDDSSLINKLK